ncbi:MAG: 16S rRNA (cytosine(967)-C(5))-methyltransferase RsmB [Oscillospiraceae bacterium]|nr:16S rRNA (cytosine(967)-C(5))-methyltransferase RsmB [Oscillospiraceae bacterium]
MTAREASVAALGAFRRGEDYRAAIAKAPEGRERALANATVSAAIRNLALIDRRIGGASSVRTAKLEPLVLDILRSASAELWFMDKIPDSAAVNEAVNLAKRRVPRASGFVNAVLRRLARGTAEEPDAPDGPARLSALYSHPEWYAGYLAERFGTDAAERVLKADNTPPPITCVANTARASRAEVAAAIRADGAEVSERADCDALLDLSKPGDITKLAAFRAGLFYVQDAGAYRAAQSCGVKPGDTAVDLCAAPGGKSFALALAGAAKVLAFDLAPRVALIRDGARRLGLSAVDARAGDADAYNETLAQTADAVLCDVPCSGFGVIRRKPEIRFKTRESVAPLPETQLRILRNGARYVKPGGRLVYSTCTLLREENEDVVRAFLKPGEKFRLKSEETLLPSDAGDGFYIAVIERM